MGTYRTAQICMNGHQITTSLDNSPELGADYCPGCGAPTISKCPKCKTNIRGYYDVPGVFSWSSNYTSPAFCYSCGSPFPWTSAKLEAAKELADDLESLTSEERQRLKASLDELSAETPRTEVAARRYKTIMKKVGVEAASAMRKILIDIVSEATRKTLFGP